MLSKNTNKKLKNLLIMIFITGGTLIMKGGALLFGFKTFLNHVFDNKGIFVTLGSAVAFLSAIYIITFTRGTTLWKGIFSTNKLHLEKKYGKTASEQLHKVGILAGVIAIVSGIGLIPVLSYIGVREILSFLQIHNETLFITLFIYCLISDYIAYLAFTTKITIENTKNFYQDLFLEKNKFTKFPLFKTLIVTSLGFLSNMSFNYFLARTVLAFFTSNSAIIIYVSGFIAILSAMVTFLSKSGNVYTAFTNKQYNRIDVDTREDKVLFLSHRIIGLCYLLCFGCAYYISCIKNFVYFGGDINSITQRLPLESIAVLTAISATYMEYALSYKEMLATFKNRVGLKLSNI